MAHTKPAFCPGVIRHRFCFQGLYRFCWCSSDCFPGDAVDNLQFHKTVSGQLQGPLCIPLRRPRACQGHQPCLARSVQNTLFPVQPLLSPSAASRPSPPHRRRTRSTVVLPTPTTSAMSVSLCPPPGRSLAYQLITLITRPISCQTAWHANRTSTFPGRYGRMVGAACVDGGRSRTSLARELCRRERWHDITGKPSPGSARGIPDRLADRVGVSPHPAAAPFGDGVAHPADGWPDTDLACSLADPDGVGLDPVYDADGRTRESMMESHHPEGWRRAPGGRMRYWIVSSAHGRLGGICFAAAGCRAGPRDRMVGWSADARMANLDRVVRNHRFPSLPPVRVRRLASRVPPPATTGSPTTGRPAAPVSGRRGHLWTSLWPTRGQPVKRPGNTPGFFQKRP